MAGQAEIARSAPVFDHEHQGEEENRGDEDTSHSSNIGI
jgi:hypothetical protein